MVKLSLKSVIFSVFTAVMSLLINSCVQPADINAFLNDPEIQGKLERERVRLTKATDAGLAVGNRMVSGLNANKYYMVKKERWDLIKKEAVNLDNGGTDNILHGNAHIIIDGILFAEDDDPDPEPEPEYEKKLTSTDFGFVSGTGKIVTDLENIGKSAVVTSLTNYKTEISNNLPFYTEYTITSAKPLTGNLTYYKNCAGIDDIEDKTPEKLPANRTIKASETDKFHVLDLSDFLKDTDADEKPLTYEHFAINPNPQKVLDEDGIEIEERAPVYDIDLEKKLLRLSRAFKTVDYLFVVKNEDEKIIDFRILTINLSADEDNPLQEDGTLLKFIVNYTGPEENMLDITITPNETEITQSQVGGSYPLTFEITNSGYTNHLWYNDVDGPAASKTDPTYTLDFWSDLKYQVAGIYKIYVSAMFTETGEYHSAVVEIEVVTQ